MTSNYVLPEKGLLERVVTIKRFEYLLLGKELKAQTDIAGKQYQNLDDTYKFDKIITKERSTLKKYSKPDLIHNDNYSFYIY